MNKNDIKTKWGQYIDTDKLVDDMMTLLTKYNHRNSEHGVCCVLEKFFTNKEPLINMLQKSEHYAGDLRIVLDEEIERRSVASDISTWVYNFPAKVKAMDIICKKTDDQGKTIGDYLRVGKQKISIADWDNEEIVSQLSRRGDLIAQFTEEGYTKVSKASYQDFSNAINVFKYFAQSTINGEKEEQLMNYKIAKGTKTSRAFNKICHHYGVDKAAQYNKEFAKYADMVSGLKRKIKFFISVNPLDYLTMSFGVNWASCHTIDRENRRRMDNSYSGMYCGGTMSYMLDQTSIVTYVHNTMPESHETGKVYRNMFHFGGDGVLLQGRVYPQGNDGCTDLYKEFRGIMQKELTNLLGLESNAWTKRSRISNVASVGCHYRDYTQFNDCNISYPTARLQCLDQTITVGSDRICFYCGQSADNAPASYLAHYTCEIPEPSNDIDVDDFEDLMF